MEWMNIQKGINRIRILGDPEVKTVHYTCNGIEPCIGPNCAECSLGRLSQTRYNFPIFDQIEGICKMFSAGPHIYKEIVNCIFSQGDPTQYDIVIEESGTGFNTHYNVYSKAKNPLWPQDQRKVNEFLSLLHPTTQTDTSEDKCKICGGIGEIRGMACVCKGCGQLIWGC